MKNWRVIYSILLVIAWVALGYLYVDYSLDSPRRSDTIYLKIEPKSSVQEIAQLLKKHKLINQDWFFRLYVRLTGKTKLQAGIYKIEPNENLDDMLRKFAEGKQEGIKVTIKEGANVLEISSELTRKGFDGNGFLKALKNRQPKYDFEKQIPNNPQRYYRLEGYLFPSTYYFKKGEDPNVILDEILAQSDKMIKKYESQMKGKSLIKNKSMTIDDVLIIASIIQNEGRVESEFKRIAGVVYNRLNAPQLFPKIGFDACSVFANMMEGGKYTRVTDMNKRLLSPYNTYLNKGLPPGPIGNPGEHAVEAAINPEKNDYYYYTARYDGSNMHYFSKTLAEHNKYIEISKKNAKQLSNS
ncbi:endolytic transglycosylase MltG [Thermoflavimicrobium dichotomicum]|uniref:Endolytic murein transglycosylase n=1 Tax=Thermoflavimicrobium dichotomicum TaxID=46223 RepID=A0A1I3MY06_9BACL|nr:endolytic transglycosylase MltG [Thermoflavimicrobium dichotomicum]SFJ01546.1 UPF0755 protein [Thermoflavimicrobium dichotomicum]